MYKFKHSGSSKQIYVIISVDTEHDIGIYRTKTAGWSKGIPLLFDVFNVSGIKGKVCWLIEYDLKNGIVAANPDSEYFVNEFPALIQEIKNRGDELGLHPTMYDWLGGNNNSDTWDYKRSYNDPEFVYKLITSGVDEFQKVCGVRPVGCRTGAFHYTTHLATALEKNNILIDSSVLRRLRHRVTAPNAYYAAGDDIRNKSNVGNGILEIPTTGCIGKGWKSFYLRLRSRLLCKSRDPIFLSFYMHNWQALTTDGEVDKQYLKFLSSFLGLLNNHGATFISWKQAYDIFANIKDKLYYSTEIPST